MIQKLKNSLLALAALLLVGGATLAVPAGVFAVENATREGLCDGVNLNPAGGSDCNASVDNDNFGDLLTRVINIFSIIVGVVAVVMIIIGGLKYITSGGDSGNVSSAKNTIIYAIVGLIIVALAQFIVRFVLGNTSDLAS
jgi:hypothetical protein